MKKFNNVGITLIIAVICAFNINVYAEDEIIDYIFNETQAPIVETYNNDISTNFYSSKTIINYPTEELEQKYISEIDNENALAITDSIVTENNATIIKSGNSENEQADLYGINAAVLCYNNGVLNLNGGTINTNGKHANAIFAYDNGTVNIIDTKVKTNMDNSSGITTTGGATISATNLNVETNGNSSIAINSNNGGETLIVNGGTYKTTGITSPVIYSKSNVLVNNSSLESTASEGIVIEGKNSITLNRVTLTSNNIKLSENNEIYKNIYIYQTLNGNNSEEENATFNAKDSKIVTKKGYTFLVANNDAIINLENNTFNNNKDFLKIQSSSLIMNLDNQKIDGNLIADSTSSLELNMKNNSKLVGTINNDKSAKEVKLTIDNTSVLILTKDTYLTSLDNSNKNNSNIYSNGYKLYVNNKEVTINNKEYSEKIDYTIPIIGTIMVSVLGAGIVVVLYKNNKMYFK